MSQLNSAVFASMMSRRQFLQRLGLTVGAATTLTPLRALAATPNPSQPLKVVIIGAGLAGLWRALRQRWARRWGGAVARAPRREDTGRERRAIDG